MKLLKIIVLLFIGINLAGCEAIQKGNQQHRFCISLTGRVDSKSNSPENILLRSVVSYTVRRSS
jgi:hypothetical protein